MKNPFLKILTMSTSTVLLIMFSLPASVIIGNWIYRKYKREVIDVVDKEQMLSIAWVQKYVVLGAIKSCKNTEHTQTCAVLINQWCTQFRNKIPQDVFDADVQQLWETLEERNRYFRNEELSTITIDMLYN